MKTKYEKKNVYNILIYTERRRQCPAHSRTHTFCTFYLYFMLKSLFVVAVVGETTTANSKQK